MGTILSTLPKIIQVSATNRAFGNFSNATGRSPMYIKAKETLDKLEGEYSALVTTRDVIVDSLNKLIAEYGETYNQGENHPDAIDRIVSKEMYGWGGQGSKWTEIGIGNLRRAFENFLPP